MPLVGSIVQAALAIGVDDARRVGVEPGPRRAGAQFQGHEERDRRAEAGRLFRHRGVAVRYLPADLGDGAAGDRRASTALYLFWVGVPVMMKVPDDQRPIYVVVAVVVGIVVNFVVGRQSRRRWRA